MTISTQALKGVDRAKLKTILREAESDTEELIKLNKKLARIIKEAIEESGDTSIGDAIATKIKERILP